jgi:hypothetical protein
MTRHFSTAAAALAAAAVLAAGCGGGSTGAVSGEVTLDGQPLKDGFIRFVPADGKAAAVDGPIADGKFRVAAVPVGEVKVEVTAQKVVGKHKVYDAPDSPTVDITEQYIPQRYNAQTELKMTVQAGPQEKKFELTSDPKRK